jgi:hypothetical protein
MLARFQAAGGKVNWDVYTDAEVKGTFSHPSGGSVTLSWTLEPAKRLGLAGKEQIGKESIRGRCSAPGSSLRAVRTICPGCVVGVYTPEEVQDFEPNRPVRDMGQVEVVQEEEFIKSDELPPAGVDIWPLNVPGRVHDAMRWQGRV